VLNRAESTAILGIWKHY